MVMEEELGGHVPDWAKLGDPLSCIADLAHSVKDRIRMSAVCRSWRAIDVKINKRIKSPVCLMLAETEKSGKCCFYNVSEETLVELDLPEIRGRRCLGSPFGWLVTCSLDLEIQLFNPLSRATLPLPSTRFFTHHLKDHPVPPLLEESSSEDEDLLEEESSSDDEGLLDSSDDEGFIQPDDFPEKKCKYLVRNFIVSSNPADSDCIVLALYLNNVLAFAKPGSKAWTPIDDTWPVEDAIYFKGNFYGCKCSGEIFLCHDLDGSHPKAVNFAPPPRAPSYMSKYIFDLGGNLCLAYRSLVQYRIGEGSKCIRDYVDEYDIDDEDIVMRLRYSSLKFMIFKLDMQSKRWEKIYSLGGRSLFLGNCSTFVVAAADHPGCKPNCIYFADDNLFYVHDSTKGRGIDMGIYDCQNLKLRLGHEFHVHDIVEPFPKFRDVPRLLEYVSLSPPLWIIPYSK